MEIRSVQDAADQSVSAIGEIGGWTSRLSASANEMTAKVSAVLRQSPFGLIRGEPAAVR
ncbi:MAG: hypothetical protein ABSG76_13380 [Xanthobacteraceae bacterium]|jgi:hypothetical protein